MHRTVIADQQIGGRPHLADLLGGMAVAVGIARQVQTESVHPTAAEPDLLHPGDVGELRVLNSGTVPDQPADAVGLRRRPEEGHLIVEAVGQSIDVLDEPGDAIAQQFPGGGGVCGLGHESDATLADRGT